uniref:C-type lectin domain-containing protein n=1 Tax=Poecilia latipinna TaxID=48699 RepID=A0A3B3UD33_9TELE
IGRCRKVTISSYCCVIKLEKFLSGFAGLCSRCLCVQQHQYAFYDTPKTWTEAKTYTDLVSLRNDAEYQTVQDLVNGTAVHVGLFRDSWVWSDMTDSSFRYWQEKQGVYTSGLEYCAALLKTESGKWGDSNCTEAHPFVCKCSK